MTTIVCDGHTMCGDTQLTGDDGQVSVVRKVFKVHGTLLGIAGTYDDCMQFVEWFKGGGHGKVKLDDVSAIMLRPNGHMLYFDGSSHPYRIRDKFTAIGSGSSAALGAMHMGASPKQAVAVASKVDSYTGGKITTRTIKG